MPSKASIEVLRDVAAVHVLHEELPVVGRGIRREPLIGALIGQQFGVGVGNLVERGVGRQVLPDGVVGTADGVTLLLRGEYRGRPARISMGDNGYGAYQ